MLIRMHQPTGLPNFARALVTAYLRNKFTANPRLDLVKRPVWCGLLLLTLLCLGGAPTAQASPIVVTYTSTRISGSEWQYDYKVSGSLLAGDDLAVYFPLATSSVLVDLGTGGSDWTTFVFQPDPGLPADGEFDMLAKLNNPSMAPAFDVTFLYSGTGSPGSQPFTLYDPNFNILAGGSTQPAIPSTPEPTSLLLVGTGLLGLCRCVRRSR